MIQQSLNIILKLLWMLLLGYTFTCCAVIPKIDRPNLERLDETNISKLDGLYQNISTEAQGTFSYSIWDRLVVYSNKRLTNWENHTIKIESISSKKILLSLMYNDQVVDQKIIRGKIKDGYFYRRPIFIVMPFFPLIYGYNTNRSRFGLVEDELVIDDRKNIWMGLLIMGKYKKSTTSLKYKKILRPTTE